MVIINEQRLQVVNNGTNFSNIEKNNQKKYYIDVSLEVRQTLKWKEEEVVVNTNIFDSLGGYRYRGGFDVEEFFKELENFVKCPLGVVTIPNRALISDGGGYRYRDGLGEIKDKVRSVTINFDDIDLTIGELATIKLKELGVENFTQKVKDILKIQEESNKLNKQATIDAYVCLKDKILALKNLLSGGKKKSRGYDYYGSNTDETLKLLLSPEIYNEKLKEVEKELRKLEKELGLKEEELEFIKIKTEESEEKAFKEWFAENEEQLREDFDLREEDNEMTFDEYVEMVYSESDIDEE
jgi:hypothetical protein